MKKNKRGITITWLGHSAFHILTAENTSILIDPWLTNPKAPARAVEIFPVNIILVTHGHSDHLGETIDTARRTGAKVFAIYEMGLYLERKGVRSVQMMNKGGTVTVDGLRVSMVDAKHSSTIDDNGSLVPAGEAAGFVIRCENGQTIYHAGDTAVFSDMVLIGKLYKPDVAILPIGNSFTMGPEEAAMACQLLKPKTIIGMHYGTFPALSGTPQQLKKLLSPDLKKRVVELHPGVAVEIA
jgi:L-ascorbate metabolism protein UlaG (beta-lactamase superfamily)